MNKNIKQGTKRQSNKLLEYSELLIENLYKLGFKVIQQNVYIENPNYFCLRVRTKYFDTELREDHKAIINVDKNVLVRTQIFKLVEEIIKVKLSDEEKQIMRIAIQNE